MADTDPTSLTLRDGTPIELRAAHPDDAPAGLDYSEDIHTNDAAHLLTEPDEFDADLGKYRERIAKSHADPRSLHLYAWADGRVVGDAMLVGGSKRRVRHTAWVGVGVRPAWQRRGLARALVTALLDWASAHEELERVSLRVFAGNARAIPLYRSLGFVEEARCLRAFRLADGSYADEFSMVLYVKPGVAPEPFRTHTPRRAAQ